MSSHPDNTLRASVVDDPIFARAIPELTPTQFAAVASDLPVKACKTGMLATRDLVELVAAQHPGLHRDEPRPIGKGGDRTKVFADVLFADQPHRNDPAIGIQWPIEGTPQLSGKDQQGKLLATSFHPELTGDDRFHRYFLTLAEAASP